MDSKDRATIVQQYKMRSFVFVFAHRNVAYLVFYAYTHRNSLTNNYAFW